MTLPWLNNTWQRLNRTRLQGRLPHALLLRGPEGIGKQKLAQELAESLLCEHTDEEGRVCGQCKSCGWLRAGTHPDLLYLQPKEAGKAIKVDQVRELGSNLSMTSHGGRYKVAIIVPADAMNVHAANSLLKTLEEPPQATLLVLVTSLAGHLPQTIRSRCQQVPIGLPAEPDATNWLQEQGMEAQLAVRSLLLSRGAVLNALTLVEKGALDGYDQQLTQLARLRTGDILPSQLAKEWSGDNERQILEWWLSWVHDLIVWKQAGKQPLDQQTARNLQELAETVDCRRLFDFSGKLTDALNSLGSGLVRQLILEDLLISWSRLANQGSKPLVHTRK